MLGINNAVPSFKGLIIDNTGKCGREAINTKEICSIKEIVTNGYDENGPTVFPTGQTTIHLSDNRTRTVLASFDKVLAAYQQAAKSDDDISTINKA